MIAWGLRKLAKANNMNIDSGIAYGSLQGYAATLSEGNGYKMIVFSTQFPEPHRQDELMEFVNQRDVQTDFRVIQMTFAPNGIHVVFYDNPGTMKMIEAFLAWFIPLLGEYGATGVDICAECGLPIDHGRWVLEDGAVAFHLHETCAAARGRSVDAFNEQQAQERTGSYLSGLLGAFLGAALGSILWAILLCIGFLAAIVGVVIGWLAQKGYDLLGGKQGKGKVFILILAVIFGVLLGTFLGDALSLLMLVLNGELPGLAIIDIPFAILLVFLSDSSYRIATLGNVVMGLLMAGLGVFSQLRRTRQETADKKLKTLK